MVLAQVVGNLWATKKAESIAEYKLLVLRQLYEDNSSEYKPMVACDTLDAGVGDVVITVKGSSARRGSVRNDQPVDCAIVGIVDEDKAAQLISEEEENV
jgi:ethanolamine utilization protein EutN